MRKSLHAFFLLPALLVSQPTTEMLDTSERKAAFLESVPSKLESLDQAMKRDQEASRRAMKLIGEAKNKHDSAPSNKGRAQVMLDLVCQTEIITGMGRQALGIQQGRASLSNYLKTALATLKDDPVSNPYAWYQQFDFEKPYRDFVAFDETLDIQMKELTNAACDRLRAEVFPEILKLAERMDAINEELKTITDANAIAAKKAELKTLNTESDRLMAKARQTQKEATAPIKTAALKLLQNLQELKIPDRGQINKGLTYPKRINLNERQRFVVKLYGKHLPRDLKTSDILCPTGLKALEVSGGGASLYIYLEKNAAIADGENEIQVAGEPLKFNFDSQKPHGEDEIETPENEPTHNQIRAKADIPENGLGTFLLPSALLNRAQPLTGYWEYNDETKSKNPERADDVFNLAPYSDREGLALTGLGIEPFWADSLTPHKRFLKGEGPGGLLAQLDKKLAENTFSGLAGIVEKKVEGVEPKCPQYHWWPPAVMTIGDKNLTASMKIDSREHNKDCESTEQPDAIDVQYQRFVGLSFVPIKNQFYIHTFTVAAPFQFKAAVKLAWNYSRLKAKRIRIQWGTPEGINQMFFEGDANLPQTKDFLTEAPGRYEFLVEIFNDQEKVIHTDYASAWIDNL